MAFDGPTRPQQEADVDVLTLTEEPYSLIVWNDEVNTFEWVIETLMEVCGHSLPGQIRRQKRDLRRIKTPMRRHDRTRDRRHYRDGSRLTGCARDIFTSSPASPQKP